MHRLFISYTHENKRSAKFEDYLYKRELESTLQGRYIVRSLMIGEYASGDPESYINRLLEEEKVSDTSITIVICGPETWERRHVDWEICAGLGASPNGSSGLIGILLPNHPDYGKKDFDKRLIPPRLLDNIESGYAGLYRYDQFVSDYKKIIEEAYRNRTILKEKVNNSRPKMADDLSL